MTEMFNMGLHSKKDPIKNSNAYEAWSVDKNNAAFNQVISELEPTITKGLNAFGSNDPSLRSKAYILAGQAINSFDPTKGATLNTYVYGNLQRLNRIRSERTRALHIPENQRVDHTNIINYTREYRDKHGHDPSVAKMGNRLHMSAGRVKKALNIAQQSESQRLSEKGDLPTSSRKSADEIWRDYVYHDMDEINKKIFEWSTGYHGSKIFPKKEIAKRLGISGPAVSKRVNTIMKQLEEGLSDDVLG